MARLTMYVAASTARDPSRVKFRDFIRFHDTAEPGVIQSPEAFAALFGAKKKEVV